MPNSFENGVIARQSINQGLLQSVRLVGEYRRKQALFKQQSPRVLDALRESAMIRSTESSNRIEGIVAPLERIRDLVAHRTTPANRSEQEIAGYRDVLNTIHSHPADITLTSNVVLQLHRDMLQFVPGGGGRWKSTDNDITESRPDGTTALRFKPLADWSALDRTDVLLLDVREPDEFSAGHIPGAINLPLSQMRDRYAELPATRNIWTSCGVGQRAYFANRFLAQQGYRSRNLSGGLRPTRRSGGSVGSSTS